MSKTKELNIDSNLWKRPNEIVELTNLELEKIKIVDNENNIEYNNRGFWLRINNLKGHFKKNNKIGYLKLLFSKQQEKMYNKIWKSIGNNLQTNNIVHKYSKEFAVYDNSLPNDQEFIINKIIIVIKSVFKHKSIILSTNFIDLLFI